MVKNENINIEYEARALINEKQYFDIVNDLKLVKKVSKNTNNYFDYVDLYLTNHHIVLRTRNISDDHYELTLKIKGESGDIEHNLQLSKEEYEYINENVIFPNSEITHSLLKENIDLNKLKKITTLITERIECEYHNSLLVIDKNMYNGKVDYNVEVEADSKESAIKILNEYFSKYGVKYKKGYISKSRRAIFKL